MDSGFCTVGGDVATDAMLSPHLIYLLRSKTLSLRFDEARAGRVCPSVRGDPLSSNSSECSCQAKGYKVRLSIAIFVSTPTNLN
jgi:hypothetical protein